MSVDVKDSFNSTATGRIGDSRSGEISGGSAFNIGGINLGAQSGISPAQATGGNPTQSLAAAAFGSYTPMILLAAVAVAAVFILRQ